MEYTKFISDGFNFLLFPLLSSRRIFYSQKWDKEESCTHKNGIIFGERKKKLSSHGNITS